MGEIRLVDFNYKTFSYNWGISVVLQMFPEPNAKKNVCAHFKSVDDALNKLGLVSDMIKVYAFATIRTETGDFLPKEEAVSGANTRKLLMETAKFKKTNNSVVDAAIHEANIASYSAQIQRKSLTFAEDPLGLYKDFGKYENRKKNLGNDEYGDGFKYRGRGFVQLTGKANYVEMSYKPLIPSDLDEEPDQAMLPDVAAFILGYYILDRYDRIKKSLLYDDLEEARACVNGRNKDTNKPNGLKEFIESYRLGMQLLQPIAAGGVST